MLRDPDSARENSHVCEESTSLWLTFFLPNVGIFLMSTSRIRHDGLECLSKVREWFSQPSPPPDHKGCGTKFMESACTLWTSNFFASVKLWSWPKGLRHPRWRTLALPHKLLSCKICGSNLSSGNCEEFARTSEEQTLSWKAKRLLRTATRTTKSSHGCCELNPTIYW
jgi:hypothetical protein